jgi:hypothetical protein
MCPEIDFTARTAHAHLGGSRCVIEQNARDEESTALQQRQTGCDELLGFEAVDPSAAGGDRDWKEAERVAHGRKAYSSKRVMAPLSRFAISARCWLDSET